MSQNITCPACGKKYTNEQYERLEEQFNLLKNQVNQDDVSKYLTQQTLEENETLKNWLNQKQEILGQKYTEILKMQKEINDKDMKIEEYKKKLKRFYEQKNDDNRNLRNYYFEYQKIKELYNELQKSFAKLEIKYNFLQNNVAKNLVKEEDIRKKNNVLQQKLLSKKHTLLFGKLTTKRQRRYNLNIGIARVKKLKKGIPTNLNKSAVVKKTDKKI